MEDGQKAKRKCSYCRRILVECNNNPCEGKKKSKGQKRKRVANETDERSPKQNRRKKNNSSPKAEEKEKGKKTTKREKEKRTGRLKRN
jgi:hypothetical protein